MNLGSTFKLITSSVALEENIVEPDHPGDFFCDLSYHVGDKDIRCWSKTAHKSQSLREALEHSCNPAFMQLGQKIGAKTLYKYYDAFGFFDRVGNNIASSYPGRFFDLNTMGAVELATMSFGQRITISPLQLISAVSTIANDGIYIKPRIIKKIENTDTASVQTVETERIRQVISKETADKVKSMMQSVVTDGSGAHAAVNGYNIGGKSGTSEPTESKKSEGYVASFVSVAPIDNPQLVCLVIIYGLTGEKYHGGPVAGPVTSQILSEVLPYLGINSDGVHSVEDDANNVAVSNITGKTIAEAKRILEQIGFNVKINSSGDENTTLVTDQVPKSGISLNKGSIVYLYSDDSDVRVSATVPNVKGMNSSDAIKTLKDLNFNVKVSGSNGNVVSQTPSYGDVLEEGSVVNIVIKEELKDEE